MAPNGLLKAVASICAVLESLDTSDQRRALRAVLALQEGQGHPADTASPGSGLRRGPKHALSDDQAREYRRAYKSKKLTVANISQQTGLSRQSVYHLLQGKTYRHVPEE